ncbi:hypothetical protein SSX86_017433 [Deinandra increscens subsp. villosa]|uniref:Uncharacterized protein n=1 Tax=Deinandra increscens subsp. villosa TaxID=3103831 RepID=A0AAP0D2G1_9ASTR
MTMFPAHLSSSSYVNGGFSEGGSYDCFISLGRGLISSDLMADQDESRTETSVNYEEAGSSSKEINTHDEINTTSDHDDHGRWLQLSLGGGHMEATTNHPNRILTGEMGEMSPPSVTLNLLTGGGGASSSRIQQPPPPPQLIFQVPEFAMNSNSGPFMSLQQLQQQQYQQERQETNYNYLHLVRPFPANMMTTSQLINPAASSSSSFSGSLEQQHGRAIHVHRWLNVARVVNPPRRPHSGVWFMLQASQNQAKEPFLPQIPKSYLRIKDGRMTVGLLIKYLVNKLELGSESEVEITCKGHQLLSLLTLQHVRDAIWNSPRNDVGFSVVPRSSATINHLMVLNYGRIA